MTLTADPHLRVLASLDSARSDVVIARSAVTRGELPQMSIGFTVNKARDDWNPDYTERIIREVNLMEVSIVRQGANPHTAASMRSLDDLFEALETGDMPEADVMRAFRALAAQVRATMPDLADTPTGVAAALDAIIDEIIDSLAEGDMEAAIALATAADITADSLLALLGMPEDEAMEEPPDPMRSANPFAERDRADRDRLERLCLLR